MKKTILLIFVIALSGASLQAQPKIVHNDRSTIVGEAQAEPATLQKIFSNLGPSTTAYDGGAGFGVSGPDSCGTPGSCYYEQIGMAFTPASNAEVKQVRVAIQYYAGTNQVEISLYSSNFGVPGTLLAGPVTASNLPTGGTCCTLAIANMSPGVAVAAGLQYWVVASAPSSGTGSDFSGLWSFVPPPKANYVYAANSDGAGWFAGLCTRPSLQARCTARSSEVPPKTEMLTPKGEHPFPLFYQGDVRWENQFRRNRNSVKNLW